MTRTTSILLTVGALFTLAGCPNTTGAHKGVAEDEAKGWANELGLEYKSVSCVAKDTDGDGYVSCTFLMKDGVTTKAVECAGARSTSNMIRNSGCRDPKLGGVPQ